MNDNTEDLSQLDVDNLVVNVTPTQLWQAARLAGERQTELWFGPVQE